MEGKEEVRLPAGMTEEEFIALLTRFDARRRQRNERARLRYRWKKEGKIPDPKFRSHYTFILPNTRAHDLLRHLREGPIRIEEMSDRESYQFLRLLKWGLIYLDASRPGFVFLNRPSGEDVLNLLDQEITATIYK